MSFCLTYYTRPRYPALEDPGFILFHFLLIPYSETCCAIQDIMINPIMGIAIYPLGNMRTRACAAVVVSSGLSTFLHEHHRHFGCRESRLRRAVMKVFIYTAEVRKSHPARHGGAIAIERVSSGSSSMMPLHKNTLVDDSASSICLYLQVFRDC